MNMVEAMEALLIGKKVRRTGWVDNAYIYEMGGSLYDQNGRVCGFTSSNESEWEVYDDRKEAPQAYKDLYKLIDILYNDVDVIDDVHTQWTDKHGEDDYIIKLYQQLQQMNKEYKLDK